MVKKLVFLCLLLTFSVKAQDTIRVQLNSFKKYDKVMLYSVTGANQKYIANSDFEENELQIIIPNESPIGMYRLYVDSPNTYFDLLYNHENISVSFDPEDAENTAIFDESRENIIYQTYLNQIEIQQYKLDSLQYAYFTPKRDSLQLKSAYKTELPKLYELQNSYEINADGLLAYHFIKANEKYYEPEIIETPELYLENLKAHFFDYIDFSNQQLLKSSFFVDHAIEYIFYMNGSDDIEKDKTLKKEAIYRVADVVGENYEIKSEIFSSLMYAFAGQQQLEMVDFVKNVYYLKLPKENQSDSFLSEINKLAITAIGAVAPEISWTKNGETKKLSELDIAQKYIVVFWSTTCSHCLVEVPELYEFSKSLDNVKVIAIALEENEIGFNEHTKSKPNWIHVLGLNKWENEFAKSYQISSTPTYFVLDKDKKILAKPGELKDVELYFKGY